MSLTSREVALSIIPHFSGGLSMIGSAFVALCILFDRTKRKNSYHRLIFCMSCCDVVSSFCYFLSTWPIPQGVNVGWNSPYHYGASGNRMTCTAQGFGIQFGVAAAFYNTALSVHFLLVVRYNYTEDHLRRRVGPFLLIVPLIVSIAFCVPGLFLQIYNNSSLWCWISPNWGHCEGVLGINRSECIKRAYYLRWIFYFGPMWVCIFLITFTQILLYWTVRDTTRKMVKYRHRDSTVDGMTDLVRRVAKQAALYVLVFYISWLPYTMTTVTALLGFFCTPHNNGFWFLLVIVICQPLQGFLNFFVYTRRQVSVDYNRIAAKHQERMRRSVTIMLRSLRRSITTNPDNNTNGDNDNGKTMSRGEDDVPDEDHDDDADGRRESNDKINKDEDPRGRSQEDNNSSVGSRSRSTPSSLLLIPTVRRMSEVYAIDIDAIDIE